LNKGPKTIFFTYKPTSKAVNAIDQIINLLKQQDLQTIIKIDIEKDEGILVSALWNSTLKDRVILFDFLLESLNVIQIALRFQFFQTHLLNSIPF